MNNDWIDIKGYDFKYQINKDGVVRRFSEQCPHCEEWFNIVYLEGTIANTGYKTVALKKNGVFKHKLLHRLLAQAFIPNPEGKPEVNHIDYDRTNNSLSNLEWVTRSENQYHAVRKDGRNHAKIWEHKKGKNHPSSKKVYQYTLDGEFVREWDSTMDIQRELGVNNSHISKTCVGKYSHAGGFVWRYNKAFEILEEKI